MLDAKSIMIPTIGGAPPSVAANEIVQILNLENGPWIHGLNNQFAQMNDQLARMNKQFALFALRFDHLDDQLVDIRRRLSAIETIQMNSAALKPDDILLVPHNQAGADPPEGLAQFTVSRLFGMGAADLGRLENYYGMRHRGVLELRRQKMLRRIGAMKLIV